jgi:hypothetical protein
MEVRLWILEQNYLKIWLYFLNLYIVIEFKGIKLFRLYEYLIDSYLLHFDYWKL